jgi:hypothetical protein
MNVRYDEHRRRFASIDRYRLGPRLGIGPIRQPQQQVALGLGRRKQLERCVEFGLEPPIGFVPLGKRSLVGEAV